MAISPVGRIRVNVTGARGLRGLVGPGSGELGNESVTADTIDGSEANAIADKIGALRPGGKFISNYADGATSEASGLIYIEANLASSKDLIRLDGILRPGAASYHLHITSSADAGVSAGGAMGIALNGAGIGSAGTFNRYEGGPGNGVLGQRVGAGNGSGLYGSFAGSGTGSAIAAFKQNVTGVAGGPFGLGPAVSAVNASEQGEAIDSLTEANNQSLVSNTFTRRNITSGIISRMQYLVGGARTGFLTGSDVIIQPSSALTGASPVTAYSATITANVTGANTVTGYDANIIASGCNKAYGFTGILTGNNSINYAGYFAATGGTNNFGIYVAAGNAYFQEKIQAPSLPVYADNAAASAALQIGDFYRTATGVLMVRY